MRARLIMMGCVLALIVIDSSDAVRTVNMLRKKKSKVRNFSTRREGEREREKGKTSPKLLSVDGEILRPTRISTDISHT